jgi:hypothetical protein
MLKSTLNKILNVVGKMDVGEYFNLALEFIRAPVKAFDSVKKKKMGEAFQYMLILGVIVAVLGGIVTYVTDSLIASTLLPAAAAATPAVIISSVVFSYVFMVILNILFGLWLHLWVYIFGSKRGLDQTMKVVFYSDTPSYLLGWIPVVGIITIIWSFVLSIFGLMRLHDMKGGRATAAVVISVLIPTIVAFVLVMVYLIPLLALSGLA